MKFFFFSFVSTPFNSFSLLSHLNYQILPKAIENAGNLMGCVRCAVALDTILGACVILFYRFHLVIVSTFKITGLVHRNLKTSYSQERQNQEFQHLSSLLRTICLIIDWLWNKLNVTVLLYLWFSESHLQPSIVKAHADPHTSFQQVKVHLKFNLSIMCAALRFHGMKL